MRQMLAIIITFEHLPQTGVNFNMLISRQFIKNVSMLISRKVTTLTSSFSKMGPKLS